MCSGDTASAKQASAAAPSPATRRANAANGKNTSSPASSDSRRDDRGATGSTAMNGRINDVCSGPNWQ